MSQTMRLGEKLARELCAVADSLLRIADFIAQSAPAPEQAPDASVAATEPATEVKLEDVRAVLAEKSRAGHTADVRELLLRHGANKLSEIDPSKYPALLAEAAEVGLSEGSDNG